MAFTDKSCKLMKHQHDQYFLRSIFVKKNLTSAYMMKKYFNDFELKEDNKHYKLVDISLNNMSQIKIKTALSSFTKNIQYNDAKIYIWIELIDKSSNNGKTIVVFVNKFNEWISSKIIPPNLNGGKAARVVGNICWVCDRSVADVDPYLNCKSCCNKMHMCCSSNIMDNDKYSEFFCLKCVVGRFNGTINMSIIDGVFKPSKTIKLNEDANTKVSSTNAGNVECDINNNKYNNNNNNSISISMHDGLFQPSKPIKLDGKEDLNDELNTTVAGKDISSSHEGNFNVKINNNICLNKDMDISMKDGMFKSKLKGGNVDCYIKNKYNNNDNNNDNNNNNISMNDGLFKSKLKGGNIDIYNNEYNNDNNNSISISMNDGLFQPSKPIKLGGKKHLINEAQTDNVC